MDAASEKAIAMGHPTPEQRRIAEQAVGLAIRVFRPVVAPAALVLHLHGGAFTEDAARCPDAVARLLAEAGAVVVSVDYPTGPAHPFPAGLKASFGALQALAAHRAVWAGRRAKLLVAGEESGGNLAAALAMMARDQGGPALAGQILVSPMLDPCLASASMRQANAGPAGGRLADGWQGYLGSAEQAAHPYAAPSNATRLERLPPTLVVTAQDDPLLDESLCYAGRLAAAGVATESHVLPTPTGWPATLGSESAGESPCAPVARQLFRAFLAGVSTDPSRPASAGLGALR
jgi:acetyl esterase/lipase